MREISKKLEDINSEMKNHELVEDSETVVLTEFTDGVDEVHVTVKYENLEEVKEYINDYGSRICVLNINDMNVMKSKIEDDDKYKLKVGSSMRM